MKNSKPKNMLQVINERARIEPKKIAFTFYVDPPVSYSQLWQEITLYASHLLEKGFNPKETAIIAIPNSSHFFYSFYGVQAAGGIAVPVFPNSGAERIIRMVNFCNASFLMISKTFPPRDIDEIKNKMNELGIKLVILEEIHPQTMKELPKIHSKDISFIQFTSGSVGNPKGVQLSHFNIITNLNQMITGMKITSKDTFVSWLPVYHDMGLVLMTMVPFYMGLELKLIPTGLNYLKPWLKTIEEQNATFTAAPDFAYRLCLMYIKNPGEYDLSSLRVALNAAEPVRSSTIEKFEQRFNLQNILLPAYGLAEATVGVCSWKPGEKIEVDKRGFVSVGSPFPGVEIEIVNNEKIVKPMEVGEICVKSPANTCGYFKNPKATEELFFRKDYIRTGDLGYVDNKGHYFIVGREKNIIIHGGMNISTQEIEEWIDEFPFVRRSAAIGIDRGSHEGEQVYVFIEINLNRSQMEDKEELLNISLEVTQRFDVVMGFRPGRVYLMKHGAIPMTDNGKIQHPQLKKKYLSRSLRREGLILFPDY